jgi:protein-disulfide isomerase
MSTLRAPVNPRDHVRGPVRASITLVEYGDFQSPDSAGAFSVLDSIEKRFVQELRFVFRHFPLTDIHPLAMLAAEAAEAAGAQNKFWQMHHVLFTNQPNFELDELVGYASFLDLDIDAFLKDLERHRHREHVRQDFMGGVRSSVDTTPCLFINDRRYVGHIDVTSVARAIDHARRRRFLEHR